MKNIVDVLFYRIAVEAFEPLAVGMLLGAIFVLCRHWRRSRAETLLFAGILLYAVVWRVSLPIISERYALFLVPAAIFFSCIAIRDIAAFVHRFLPRIPWNPLCFCAMFIAMIVIGMRVSREDRAFFPLLEAFRREIRTQDGRLFLVAKRDFSVFLDPRVEIVLVDDWEEFPRHMLLASGTRYGLFRCNRKQRPAPEQLRFLTPIASVEGRGRQKFSYFLWKAVGDPHCRAVRLPDAADAAKYAASSSDNLLGNAGFECLRSEANTRTMTERYVKQGADFYRKPDLKLPSEWTPSMWRVSLAGAAPEFELVSDTPILGKYSLRMKIDPRLPREIVCARRVPPGDYAASLLVRAKKGARFRLGLRFSRKGKPVVRRSIVRCDVLESGTWFVSVPVRREDFPEDGGCQLTLGGLAGEMFFDEISLCPVRPAAKAE